MDLHKVEFFVEDKRLAQINRLLTGLVLEYRTMPVPTGNAQAINGKVTAVGESGAEGTLLMGLKPGVHLTTQEAKAKLVAAGYTDKRHNGALHSLTKAGVLRNVAKGVYELAIVKKGKSKPKSRSK